jgi:flagellar biosynthesis protein FlhF
MRIKTYTATTMEKAMNQVRLEMGAEAIILSTQETDKGSVQLTAAVEQPEMPLAQASQPDWAASWDDDWKAEAKQVQKNPTSSLMAKKPVRKAKNALPRSAKMEVLVQSMAYHGIPTLLAERLCRTALAVETDDITIALAASLDNHFRYSARLNASKFPLMLVGPPGVGKTLTVAKIAASAKMDGRQVHVITSDTSRTGAVDQLKAYTDILGIDLSVAETAKDLAELRDSPELNDGGDILIDTGGINTYETAEIEELTLKIVSAKAEPVVVLAAGTDTAEMSDMAQTFAALGAKRLITTRLDTTRRYGGLFTAADSANLSFAHTSVSASVATGLHTLNPVNLARLILRDPSKSGLNNEFDKVLA